nr:tetratricopeptide repeat protein [Gemmatimonadales bacterium]
DLSGVEATPRSLDAFGLGLAALRRGERGEAQRLLGELVRRGKVGGGAGVPPILEKELRALLHLADGREDEAVALLREAGALEDALVLEYGPPDVVKPSHELFGEVLLQLGRPAEAQREFARALELGPRRALSLLGLARAAASAGDRQTAERAYADLRSIWRRADPDMPGVAEAAARVSSAE